MTTPQSLRDTVLGIARTGALARALPPAGTTANPEAMLRHLAGRIDGCVLAQRIAVALAEGGEVILEVRNRRLLRWSVEMPQPLAGHPASALDAPPTAPPTSCRDLGPGDCDAVLRAWRALFATRRVLRIASRAPERDPDPEATGLSAAALRRAIGPAGPGIPLETAIAGLAQRHADRIAAACVLAGEDILAIAGSDETLYALSDWASAVLDLPVGPAAGPMRAPGAADVPRVADLGTGGLRAYCWPGADAHALLVARRPEATGLILVEGDDGLEFLLALRAALAEPADGA